RAVVRRGLLAGGRVADDYGAAALEAGRRRGVVARLSEHGAATRPRAPLVERGEQILSDHSSELREVLRGVARPRPELPPKRPPERVVLLRERSQVDDLPFRLEAVRDPLLVLGNDAPDHVVLMPPGPDHDDARALEAGHGHRAEPLPLFLALDA